MENKEDLKRSGINLLIGLCAFAFYAVIEGLYIYPNRRHLQLDQGLFIFAATLTVLMGMYAVYSWQLTKRNNWNFNINLVSVDKNEWKKWLFTLGMFGVMFLIQFLSVLVVKGNSTNQQEWIYLSKQVNTNLLKIFLVVVAPMFEELIFRGLFFNTFFFKKTKLNLIVGIVVNGEIFALMHGLPTSWFYLVYWALGSILAANYLYTKDIRCNIVLHMLNNALVML